MKRVTLRATVAALVCLVSATLQAGIVLQGFEYRSLASTLPTGTNDAVCAAIDPTGDIWVGDGQRVYHIQSGDWGESISVIASGGGPLKDTYATTSFAFDSSGRLYVNDWRDGNVYVRSNAGAWSQFAHVGGTVRQMRFDGEGNLVVLSQTTQDFGGLAYSIDSAGTASVIGALPNGAESFDFDAVGNIIAPHYAGTGIDMLTRAGVTSTVFTNDPGLISEWGSVAVTAGGRVFIGENTGFSWDDEQNHTRFWLVDLPTQSITLVAYDLQSALPAMILRDGDTMVIAGYGSVHPGQLIGDLDGRLLATTPEPSSIVLASLAFGSLVMFRRLRSKR